MAILDNLERAKNAIKNDAVLKSNKDLDKFLNNISIIEKDLISIFEKNRITKVEASTFVILFFSKIEIKSFSIIDILFKNLSKSLFDFNTASFLIAFFALSKLSKIAKLSFAKLKDPNSKASLISFSNLLL